MSALVIKKGFSTPQSTHCIPSYILDRNASMCSSVDMVWEWSEKHAHNFSKVETTKIAINTEQINTL